MTKIPLVPIEQEFSDKFIFWYYNYVTSEAVIVLKNDPKICRKIRVYDPMWLVNLSKEDVKTLHLNQIHFQDQDADQAVRLQKMVRYCFAKKVHAGCDWSKLPVLEA